MIAILSDTHENIPIIQAAVKEIKKLNPTHVIHCGDIISPPTLEEFKDLPMHFVFGNNDGEKDGLNKKAKELGFPEIVEELEITFFDKRFFVYHGTKPWVLDEMIGAQLYDYVLHGHTHIKRDERHGRTRVINPGALFSAKEYSFALLDPVKDNLEFYPIKKLTVDVPKMVDQF